MGNEMNIDFGRSCQSGTLYRVEILRACRLSITPLVEQALITDCSACVAQAPHSKAAQLVYCP
jgi:hypothetical protein